MKRIKIIIIISIIALTGSVIIVACKKSFLNQTNTFGLPPDAVASTKENVIGAVNAIYDTYQIPSTFLGLNTLWNQFYIGIARANYALPVVAKAKENGVVDAALADRLAGEAYFLRGTMYYYLAACFGGVPLELNTGSEGLAPRSSR